ncbi:MAG: metallophosphoesterase family protein [Bryobacteraceae bacterium]
MNSKKGSHGAGHGAGRKHQPPPAPPPADNSGPIPTGGAQFGEPSPTPDPSQFTVKHGSDTQAYKILDSEQGQLKPRPFPVAGVAEPTLSLADAIGGQGPRVVKAIQSAGQIVFHAVGDTGNTTGPKDEELVADKMVADFTETDPKAVPSFCYHLGDVVYSFGEAQYYYDQFYDPYRNYPAPIFAVPGNHDGMVAPNTSTPTLQAFLANFCTAGQPFHKTPEAGGLSRTAGIQAGVYFTLEAPFVRILGLYSNCLEDPGVISTQGGTYPYLSDAQLTLLKAALQRVKDEKFAGAVVIAVHHPPYVAQTQTGPASAGKHGGSPLMLKDIDAACAATGVWPHAVLSGHAHNYQRFTRVQNGRQTPFLVAGNGGHGLSQLTHKGSLAIRVPVNQPGLSQGNDTVTFENYDDQDFGYLRIVVDPQQLRIEYHPESDGEAAKTPDDAVTVDLASHQIVQYEPAA